MTELQSNSVCVILDNDIVAEVLFGRSESHFFQMQIAIDRGDVIIYSGGKLRREYKSGRHKNGKVMHRILELERAGRARAVSDSETDIRTRQLESQGACNSNDTHIIALANVARIGLLCTRDNELMTDFKCKALVDNPRGRIWSPTGHKNLIRLCRKHCRSE